MVGDDAQAIYAFRAATVRNILDFPARHPGAHQVLLTDNYRSTPELLEVTNRVIAQARERFPKELRSSRRSGARPALLTCNDEAEQTERVLARILERREEGIRLRDQAVLFRAAHHSLHLEVELGRRGIPFHKYGGLPSAPPLATQLQHIRAFYAPLCEERYDRAEARLRDLESLERLAAGFRDRSAFLGDLTLEPPQSTQELAGPPSLDEDYLVLSTIHSAKGLEFDAVYLLHAADGNIPSDLSTGTPAEIDEELRLLYVALSRARTHLTVSFPLRWYDRPAGVGARHSFAQPSRFLTPEVTRCFDLQAAATGAVPPTLPASEEFLPEALRKSLQTLWN